MRTLEGDNVLEARMKCLVCWMNDETFMDKDICLAFLF